MKTFYYFAIFVFLGSSATAQEQITKFSNLTTGIPKPGTTLKTHQFANGLLLIKQEGDFADSETEVWVTQESQATSSKLISFSGHVTSITNDTISSNSPKVLLLSIQEQYSPKQKVEIYETDGTVAGTRLRFSAEGIENVFGGYPAGNGIAYQVRYIDKSTKILVVLKDYFQLLESPEITGFHRIRATTSDTYLETMDSKTGESSLYLIKPDGLKLLTGNITSYLPAGDKLFTIGTRVNGQGYNFKGVSYFKGEKQVQLVSDEIIVRSQPFQSPPGQDPRYLLVQKESSAFIIDAVSDKIRESSVKLNITVEQFSFWTFDGGYAVAAQNQLELYYKGETYTVETDAPASSVSLTKGGLLILEGNPNNLPTGLSFFGFERKTLITILVSKPFKSINSSLTSNFILINLVKIGPDGDEYIYYGLDSKEIKTVSAEMGFSFGMYEDKVIEGGNYTSTALWAYDGNELTYRYALTGRTFLNRSSDQLYGISNGLKSSQLIKLTRDSIQYYNSAAIDSAITIFDYNENVYAFGFNTEQGYQVWQLGEVRDEQQNFIKPLATEEKIKLTIYPNPTTQFLNINTEQFSDYQLVNMSGVVLQKGKIERNKVLNLNGLTSGIYLLNLTSDDKSVTRRIVKID